MDKRSKRFLCVALGVLALAGCAHAPAPVTPPVVAAAQEPLPAGRAFGAIAFSRATRNQGASSGWATRGQAEKEATRLCGAPDCAVITWVEHSCAALAASGDSARWGWGADRRREKAEDNALATCGEGTNDCRVLRSVCTD